MKQVHSYLVDFTKMNERGDFSCPKCGVLLSPDDLTERSYFISEAKVNYLGLEELVICCNRCGSQIHLTGFPLLQKLEGKKGGRKRRKIQEAPWYFKHV
jgi:ribosomal protein S27AE